MAYNWLFQSTPPHGRRRAAERHCGGVSQCFNPRLRTGGDFLMVSVPLHQLKFQSTPPHGRRQGIGRSATTAEVVSIHASAREATMPSASLASSSFVSIHASAREATNPVALLGCTVACFNPRLRTGGDIEGMSWNGGILDVSIHASAREATAYALGLLINGLFQSTPPHGRRPGLIHVHRDFCAVSIHASAREATIGLGHGCFFCSGFNPRLRTGGDPCLWRSSAPKRCFNPRLRTGGDAPTPKRGALVASFNPRLRTGGDRPWPPISVRSRAFQSTPPHGRRQNLLRSLGCEIIVSIHASAREATGAPELAHVVIAHVSIHASAREATGTESATVDVLKLFQSTPPHGRRL